MNKFKFGGVDKAGIYLDETVMRMCYTHRRLLSLLAMNLVQEGKDKQAKAVLAKAEKALPSYNIPHDYQSGSLDLAKAYALTGQPKKAQQIIDNLWKKSTEYMLWYCSLSTDRFAMSQQECMVHMYILNQILNLESVVDEKQAKEKEAQFKAIGNLYETKGGTYGE